MRSQRGDLDVEVSKNDKRGGEEDGEPGAIKSYMNKDG